MVRVGLAKLGIRGAQQTRADLLRYLIHAQLQGRPANTELT